LERKKFDNMPAECQIEMSLIKSIKKGFAFIPVCTLYVRADGLGTPIGRPPWDSFGIKTTDGWVFQSLLKERQYETPYQKPDRTYFRRRISTGLCLLR